MFIFLSKFHSATRLSQITPENKLGHISVLTMYLSALFFIFCQSKDVTFPTEPICANTEWTCFTAVYCHLGKKLDLRRILQLLDMLATCCENQRISSDVAVYILQHLHCILGIIILLILLTVMEACLVDLFPWTNRSLLLVEFYLRQIIVVRAG